MGGAYTRVEFMTAHNCIFKAIYTSNFCKSIKYTEMYSINYTRLKPPSVLPWLCEILQQTRTLGPKLGPPKPRAARSPHTIRIVAQVGSKRGGRLEPWPCGLPAYENGSWGPEIQAARGGHKMHDMLALSPARGCCWSCGFLPSAAERSIYSKATRSGVAGLWGSSTDRFR